MDLQLFFLFHSNNIIIDTLIFSPFLKSILSIVKTCIHKEQLEKTGF